MSPRADPVNGAMDGPSVMAKADHSVGVESVRTLLNFIDTVLFYCPLTGKLWVWWHIAQHKRRLPRHLRKYYRASFERFEKA